MGRGEALLELDAAALSGYLWGAGSIFSKSGRL